MIIGEIMNEIDHKCTAQSFMVPIEGHDLFINHFKEFIFGIEALEGMVA